MEQFNAYRHGDLMIIPVQSIPEGLPIKTNTELLEGESSGHVHRLSGGTVYATEPTLDNNFLLGYFKIEEETPLSHEEHETITLPPGQYKFLQQREYDPQENRRVID
jgi:hypothetical protein